MTHPRPLPWRTALAHLANVPACIGGALAVGGLFFSLMMFQMSDRTSRHFREDDPVVAAQVTRVVAPGRKQVRGNYQVEYRYQVAGRSYLGVSYGPQTVDRDVLPVRYVPAHPAWSRIEGMAPSPLSAWSAAIGMPFILIGVGLLVFGVRQGQGRVALLRHGIVTSATVVRTPLPAPGRGGRQRTTVLLRFTAADGSSHEIHPAGNLGNYRDGQQKRIVYRAEAPALALLVEQLPGPMRALLSGAATAAPAAA